MTADRDWLHWANRWLLTIVGVSFVGLTTFVTVTNEIALPLALFQGSLPLLIGILIVYLGVTYAHRYSLEEHRTISRFTLLGLGVLLVMAIWMRLNVVLLPEGNVPTDLALVTASAMGVAGGLSVGWLTVARNRRERELQATSRQLKGILNTVDAAIFIKDADGHYQRMNSACKDLLGIDSGTDVTGRTDFDLFPKEFAEKYRADDDYVIEHGETIRSEESVPTPAGERTLLALKSPLTDGDDNTIGVCGVATDISERKSRERELEARSTAMEASIDGMAILDSNEEYTFVNQAHANVYGYDDAEAFLGESWQMCYNQKQLDRFSEEVLPEIFEQGSWRGEAVGKRKDGTTFPQELSLTIIDDGGMVCVVRDISERKAYERELEHQNERLETFAEIVSHDLRSPMSVAAGRLELLQESIESEDLDDIEWALLRMDELIEDILTLARQGRQISETEPVEMRDVTERCWASIAATDAELNVVTDQQVQADRSRLKQLLENLFRNATDHAGTDVTVTVGALENGFYVSDDGPGIPESDRKVVFERGHSIASEGTGFGLSIVAEIAKAHGWDVAITNSEADGARFEFTGIEVIDA